MVSVQRSIEIRVPVHALYDELTRFENYPQFMQDIESVEQRDDTHLHWTARTMDKPVEWDATITERVPDRCIAWQSENGPGNSGKVELQAVGPAASRLTLTIESEMRFELTSPAGDAKAEFSERIWENLARLRSLVESRQGQHGQADIHSGLHPNGGDGNRTEMVGQEIGPVADLGVAQGTGQVGSTGGREGIDEVARLGSVEGSAQGETGGAHHAEHAHQAPETLLRDRGSPGNPVPVSGLVGPSDGSDNSDDSIPRAGHSMESGKGPAGSHIKGGGMNASELSRGQEDNPTQSDYSLSKDTLDERDSIAEEVSFDQQSDAARHIGQLSVEDINGTNEGLPNPDVIAKAMQRKRPEPEV